LNKNTQKLLKFTRGSVSLAAGRGGWKRAKKRLGIKTEKKKKIKQ